MGEYLDNSTGSTTTSNPTDRNGDPIRLNESNHNIRTGWIKVQAKLYQAFLMSGGSTSGRIARGDALVELIFVETKVHHEDDASC
jgi:hypothetical protein